MTKGTLKAPGNELGIFESLNEYYAQDDLNNYFSRIYPTIPQGTTPLVRLVDGAPAPTNDITTAGLEATLDFEIAYPIHWPQNSVLYSVDDEWYQVNGTNYKTGRLYNGFLNTFLDAIDGSYWYDITPLAELASQAELQSLVRTRHMVPGSPVHWIHTTRIPRRTVTKVNCSAAYTSQRMSSPSHTEEERPIFRPGTSSVSVMSI